MAVYEFLDVIGTSIPFDPASDVLNINQAEIDAFDLTVEELVNPSSSSGFDTVIGFGSESLVLLDTPLRALTSTNVVFPSSQLLIGDDAVSILLDDAANTLTGGLGADQLLGLGGNDTLSGGTGNDRLDGGDGNDRLYGQAGADVMIGGNGNDVFYVTDAGDSVFEAPGGGIDAVLSTVDWTLTAGQEIEYFHVQVPTGLALTGNELADYIDGNVGDDTLDGASGDDLLTGGLGNDMLIGGLGNDTLDGGVGADLMIGGAGNDTYYLDNVGDAITEASAGGIDTVYSALSYTLPTSQEIEILRANAGTTGLTLTGNTLDNQIYGGSGGDILFGSSGNDALFGGAGNDRLYGQTGIDTLTGGSGSDVFYVTDAGDSVIETFGGGIDTVQSTVDWTLTAGQEIEYAHVQIEGGLSITGNEFANHLDGNIGEDTLRGEAGNDLLTGGAGNDTLIGGTGNDRLEGGLGIDSLIGGVGDDTYVVDDFNDVVIELVGEGNDVVFATVNWTLGAGAPVETLRVLGSAGLALTGNELANILYGGAGNDTLLGGEGRDRLYGLGGADQMWGGGGDDVFYVDNVSDEVFEAVGGGNDTVQTMVNWTMAAGQEIEYAHVQIASGLSITGNELANWLDGNIGNDVLDGGLGNDDLYGNDGNDSLIGDAGNDRLNGGVGDDTLSGGAGNDQLDGGIGNDTAIFSGKLSDYTITRNGSVLTVRDNNAADGDDGSDTLRNVEFLQFEGGGNYDVALGLTGRLLDDTGASATDGLTRTAAVSGKVSSANAITSLTAGFGNDPASLTSILDLLQPDGSFVVSDARLAVLNGGLLPDGAHTLHILATDSSGRTSPVLDVTFTLDTQAPRIDAKTPTGPSSALATQVDLFFSEPVTGVQTSNLVLSGAASTGSSIVNVEDFGGTVSRFLVTGLQEGTVTAQVQGSGILDLAGNQLTADTWTFNVDRTAPAVLQATPASAEVTTPNVNIDVRFSESVTNVGPGDLILTDVGAQAATVGSPVDLGNNTWRFPVSGLTPGPVTALLGSVPGTILDSAGNFLGGQSWSFTVDGTAPTLVGMTPAAGALVTSSTLNIDLTFSEAVTGLDASDLVLSGTGATGATVGTPTDLGANTWRYIVSNLGDGSVTATLAPDAGDITDLVGNTLPTTTRTFSVEASAPTVTAFSPTGTISRTSTNIDVTFSETVTGVDASDLVLSGPGAPGALVGTPVDLGNNTWRFPVSQLQNGSVTATIAPDAGDITDQVGNALAPTLRSFTNNLAVVDADLLVENGIGLRINGAEAGDNSGFRVSGAGDVNGDGLADALVVSEVFTGVGNPARVYIVFGTATPQTIDLGSLVATGRGIEITAEVSGTGGVQAASAGDFNADGFDDIVVGNYNNVGQSGEAYVVFGSANARTISVDGLATRGEGVLISGVYGGSSGRGSGDLVGYRVAGIGDFNADSYSDIAIVADGADAPGVLDTGAVFVVFGGSGARTLSTGSLVASQQGLELLGSAADAGAPFTWSFVDGAGDFNGDGLADLLIANRPSDQVSGQPGQAYIVFGTKTAQSLSIDNLVTSGRGTIIRGENPGDLAGLRAAGAGDFNGDGYSDVVVGAPYKTIGSLAYAGAAYVVFGSPALSQTINLGALVSSQSGWQINGFQSGTTAGYTVAGLGDTNGDGLSDVVITEDTGHIYVLFGSTKTPPTTALSLNTLVAQSLGRRITVADVSDWNDGTGVSGAGDFNGDGVTDIVFGSKWSSPSGKTNAGSTFIAFGIEDQSIPEATYTTSFAGGNPPIGGLGTVGDGSNASLPDSGVLLDFEGAAPTSPSKATVTAYTDPTAGIQLSGTSEQPSTSADGRYVAFTSTAPIFASDTNGASDVFVKDLLTGVVTMVSAGGNGASDHPSISADGRYVAFTSAASNFVLGDTNGAADVFVKDLQTEALTQVSAGGNFESIGAHISSDGRFVTFSSLADNFVAGDTNETWDAFLWDRQTGAITNLSAGGDYDSYSESISADGRFVTFTSLATNLAAGDAAFIGFDVFVKDTQSGALTLITAGGDSYSAGSNISSDGRYIAFHSNASNLVSGDTNNAIDIFVLDRQTANLTRVTQNGNGNSFGPSLSSDGRYVAFYSDASNLVARDTNGATDIFLKDMQTGSLVAITNGTNNSSIAPILSADGRSIVFSSAASNIVSSDTNAAVDVFGKNLEDGSIYRISTSPFEGLDSRYLVGDVRQITSDRATIAGTKLTLGYTQTDLQNSGLNEVDLKVLFSPDGKNWSTLAASSIAGRNQLEVTVNQFGYFAIGLPTAIGGPSASLLSNGGNVTDPSQAYHDFVVRYTDSDGQISFGSLDNGDIKIIGPAGQVQTPTLVSTSPSTNGSMIDATYRVAILDTPALTSPSLGGNGGSSLVSISGDGRYIAFESGAANLVGGDTNNASDVFVQDRQTGVVSLLTGGGNGSSGDPKMSADGRYVAFSSYASNLVVEDSNGTIDVFVKDLVTGTIRPTSSGGDGPSVSPSISANGRYVAFVSHATNLVYPDTNGVPDILVTDMQTGAIVSITAGANSGSYHPTISADGRFVAFDSYATNLVSEDTNNVGDVFVVDRLTGNIIAVTEGANGESSFPSVSADGRYVVFNSSANNLVAGDTNDAFDVFLKDLVTGNISLISAGANGDSYYPVISANGRYVAFNSAATNLVLGDDNNEVDVFLKDLWTGELRLISAGGNQGSYAPTLSADGGMVAFYSFASNFVSGDTNNTSDVFVVDRFPARDTYTISVNSDQVFDDIGLSVIGGVLGAFNVDTHAPTLVSIDVAPVSTAATHGLVVSFSEAVTGVDPSDLVLTGPAAANARVTAANTADNVTWSFQITGLVPGDAFVSLRSSEHDITDLAGLALQLSANVPPQKFTVDLDRILSVSLEGSSERSQVIFGSGSDSTLGSDIFGAGDFNGDGLGDYIITEPGQTYDVIDPGSVFIVFGSGDTSSDVDVSALVASGAGVRLNGPAGGGLGYGAAGAGDVNGDGLSDVIVSAPFAGKVYVVFGTPLAQTIDLSQTSLVSNGLGIEISSAQPEYPGAWRFAFDGAVSGAGDVNGDGLSDVIIGAPEHRNNPASTSIEGIAYLIYGSPNARTVDLGQIEAGTAATEGYAIKSGQPGSAFGATVAGVGDVNGDGFSDFTVGAPLADQTGAIDAGRVYLVYGSPSGGNLTVLTSGSGFDIPFGRGMVLLGEQEGDWFGGGLTGVGDFNGDGLADYAIGAERADPQGRSDAGRIYVIYGDIQPYYYTVYAQNIVGSIQGYVIDGSSAGRNWGSNLAGGSDINSDGYPDIVIAGSYFNDEVAIVYGGANVSSVDLQSFVSQNQGTLVLGEVRGEVAAAGDVNADGASDLIVNGGPYVGGYVIYGHGVGEEASRTFAFYSRPGDPPREAIGALGDGSTDGTPEARLWVDYSGASGQQPAFTEVSRRPIAADEFATLDETRTLGEVWHIASDRSLLLGTELTFAYLSDQVAGFTEAQLRVLYSADGQVWTPISTTVDAGRNQVTATTSSLGYFTIGLPEAAGVPTANLTSVPDITVPGGSGQQISVLFTDATRGIDLSTLGIGDLDITGPNDFSALATLINMTPSGLVLGNGAPTSVLATYQMTAPGGTWDLLDSGLYTVSLRPGEVTNTVGAAALGEALGTFLVDMPVTFGDPDVASAVEAALGEVQGAIVRVSELGGLTSLSLDALKVDNLVGLEWAKNLASLSITPSNWSEASSGIADFTPLQGLTHLASLSLQRVGLDNTELAAFATLPALKNLDVRYNEITSLGSNSYLKDLSSLSLYGNPVSDLTALKGSLVNLDLEPTNADRAKTIAELAAALNYSPVEMYEWVYNSVDFQLYSGFMKGAEATLETREGNAWDQAGLLVALYREAGIEARLVTGRASLYSLAALEPWIGVQDVEGVYSLFYYAGLDPRGDGTIKHAWVEALLPDGNGGQSWQALDTSYKAKAFQTGLPGLLTQVSFDETGYLAQTTRDLPIEYWQQQVKAYLAANYPGLTIADVGFQGPIVQMDFTTLPVMSFGTFAQARYSDWDADPTNDIPLSMKDTATLTITQGATTLLNHTFVLPDMSLERVNVSWRAQNGQELTPTFTGLVIPELRLDGQIIATGPAVAWRSTVEVGVSFDGPATEAFEATSLYGGWFGHRVFPIAAGQFLGIGLDAHQTSAALEARLMEEVISASVADRNGAPLNTDAQISALQALAFTSYTEQFDSARDELWDVGQFTGLVLPGYALMVSEPYGDYRWDLNIPFVPRGSLISYETSSVYGLPDPIAGPDPGSQLYMTMGDLVGWNASALEHDIWESLINSEAISTVKALQLASERDIPVFHINSSNAATYLPQLNLSAATEANIAAGIAHGATAIVPRDTMRIGDWQGVGYLLEGGDYQGYFGGYLIDGSLVARGGQATGENLEYESVDSGSTPGQSVAGDPVNIANGNYVHDEQDLSLPGAGFGLTFDRHYDSQATTDLGMGRGWTYTYGDELTIAANGTITWVTDQGYTLDFTPNGSGGYTNPDRYFGTFTKDASGYSYREVDGFTHRFNLSGELVLLSDRNGNQVSLAYDGGGHLATVTDVDAPTRQLVFGWTGDRLTSVSDFGGRTWNFGYSNGILSSVAAPTDATTPASVTQYAYYTDTARSGWIQSITAADGGVTTFDYYTNGRVFRVTDPTGAQQTFFYSLYHQQSEFVNERGAATTYSYDPSGRMVGMENSDHTSESFTWTNGLLTNKVDVFGTSDTYQYDSRGNIVRQVDKAGIETTFTYEPTYNQVTSIQRTADGQRTQYQYDANGNLVRMEDALGNITTMTYDGRGLVTSLTTPKGNATPTVGDYTTTYTYNAAGQVLSQSTDLPATVGHTYDALGRELSRTDANGNTTNFVYDLRDRLIAVADPLAHATQRTYDAAGHLVAVTDALGQTTSFTYDLNDRLIATTAPDGTIQRFAFDAVGNRILTTDALGQATQFVYDDRDRLVDTVAADGARLKLAYDGGSRVIAQTNALGNTTSFAYDRADRLIRTTDALGGTSTRAYDAVGHLASTTDPRGAVTRFDYDPLDRLARVEREGGLIETTTYDANGNQVRISQYDVLGLSSVPSDLSTLSASRQRSGEIRYDVADRPVETIDPLGQSSFTQYDAGGRVIGQVDARGSATTFQYDAAGNLIQRTAADGGVTQFSYDALDRVTSLTMPEGGLWQTAYDKLGHVVAQTDPQGRQTAYGYDAVGNQTRQDNADGTSVLTSYDVRNRVVQIDRSIGNDDSYSYDRNGNLLNASTDTSTTTFTYDKLNRRSSETQALDDGFSHELLYVYDAASNLISRTETGPWNRTVSYQYDLAGRLTRASGSDVSGGQSADITYNGFGERTRVTFGNGVIETTSYDAAGRISSIAYATSGGGNSSLTYVRDAGGLPTQISENLNGTLATLNLSLDAMGRVTTVSGPAARTETFSYDRDGNLVDPGSDRDLIFDSADQVLSEASGQTFTHDAQGNLTVKRAADGSRTEMVYDASDRMIEFRQYDSAGTLTRDVIYTYDALGRRVVVADGASVTHQAFAGDQLIGTVSQQGATTHTTRYLTGLGLDDVFAARVDGQSRYLHGDVVGSVRLVTDAAGSVVGTASYSQFGTVQVSTGVNDTGLGFASRPTDTGTGLIDLRARMYDPSLGQFTARDPVSTLSQGLSLYQYANNQPLVFVDPTGRTATAGTSRSSVTGVMSSGFSINIGGVEVYSWSPLSALGVNTSWGDWLDTAGRGAIGGAYEYYGWQSAVSSAEFGAGMAEMTGNWWGAAAAEAELASLWSSPLAGSSLGAQAAMGALEAVGGGLAVAAAWYVGVGIGTVINAGIDYFAGTYRDALLDRALDIVGAQNVNAFTDAVGQSAQSITTTTGGIIKYGN